MTRGAEPPKGDETPAGWEEVIAVSFAESKVAAETVTQLRRRGPFAGIVASGDRSARFAAQLAAGLGLAFHPVRAATICMDKYEFKQTLADAGLPVPWFKRARTDLDDAAIASLARQVHYPCVLKPLVFTSGRGVIQARVAEEFAPAFVRIRRLLAAELGPQPADARAGWIEIETFVDGPQFALEGWMASGELQRFALFDKAGSLDGPFFADGQFITPSRTDADRRAMIWDLVEAAARAARMGPGPVHAEIRLGPVGASMEAAAGSHATADVHAPAGAEGASLPETAYVLQLAARPIAGWRSRGLRFRQAGSTGTISLEELLIRGAIGEPLGAWERERQAAGVLLLPVPSSGELEYIRGVDEARRVPGIEAVEITAQPDRVLAAPPEANTYLGCIFARGETPAAVDEALQQARSFIHVQMRTAVPVP